MAKKKGSCGEEMMKLKQYDSDVRAIEKLKGEAHETDDNIIAKMFMHAYNLDSLCGPRLKKEAYDYGHQVGYSDKQLFEMEQKGARMSNWTKDSFIQGELYSNGKNVCRMNLR